jgi:hypothetical protein
LKARVGPRASQTLEARVGPRASPWSGENSAFLRRSSTLSMKYLFITFAASKGVVVGPFSPVMDAGSEGRLDNSVK